MDVKWYPMISNDTFFGWCLPGSQSLAARWSKHTAGSMQVAPSGSLRPSDFGGFHSFLL